MTEVVVREARTEIEASAIVAYLDSESCPATVRKREIVAYPGVLEPPGTFAEIVVAEADVERARALLATYDGASVDQADLEAQAIAAEPAPPEREREGSGPGAFLMGLALLVSLAFNAFGAYVLFFEDSPDEVPAYDVDGRLVAISRFHRGVEIPFQMDSFDREGRLIVRASDPDEDGWCERVRMPLERNATGVTHLLYVDANENGIPEEATVYAGRRAVMRSEDVDESGLFDRAIDTRGGFAIEDRDHDGMYETFVCDAGAAASRTIHLGPELCSPPSP